MATKAHQTERRRIVQEMDLVKAELQRLDVKLRDKPEWSLGDGDPTVQEWELNYALKQKEERKLKSLEAALQKLELGSYAICEICGKPIDPERLAILPETTRCVDCARKKP